MAAFILNIEQTNADALVCIPTDASGQGILNNEVGPIIHLFVRIMYGSNLFLKKTDPE
jgi:hypothetical protein